MEDAANSRDNTPTDPVEQHAPASIDAEGPAATVADDEPPASKSSSAAESDDADDNDDDDDEDLVDRRSSSKGFPRPHAETTRTIALLVTTGGRPGIRLL